MKNVEWILIFFHAGIIYKVNLYVSTFTILLEFKKSGSLSSLQNYALPKYIQRTGINGALHTYRIAIAGDRCNYQSSPSWRWRSYPELATDRLERLKLQTEARSSHLGVAIPRASGGPPGQSSHQGAPLRLPAVDSAQLRKPDSRPPLLKIPFPCRTLPLRAIRLAAGKAILPTQNRTCFSLFPIHEKVSW